MNTRLDELMHRREYLVARSAEQREELERCVRRLQAPMKLVSLGAGAIRIIRDHPSLVIGLTSFLVSRRGGKLNRTAARLLLLSQVLRPLNKWWQQRRP